MLEEITHKLTHAAPGNFLRTKAEIGVLLQASLVVFSINKKKEIVICIFEFRFSQTTEPMALALQSTETKCTVIATA